MKNEKITNYVIFQIIIFFVLIIINYFYLIHNNRVQKQLNSFIYNEENKIRLFSLISSEIESIRAKVFYLSYATSKWELNYADKNFNNHLNTLKKYLKLLDKGGSVEINSETNNVVFENNSRKIEININKLNNKNINLAQIEIYPRIIRLEKLYDEYHRLLVKKIKQMSLYRNSYELVQLIGQIQLRIKAFDPLFNSMLNQTNIILNKISSDLKNVKTKVALIKQRNSFILRVINTLSVALLLFISSFVFVKIKKILKEKELAENELRLSHENLELKVKQRTQLLEDEIEKRNEAERKIREQADFLINVINSLNHPFYVINASNYEIILANYAAKLQSKKWVTTCYEMTHKRSEPCSGKNHICPLETIKQTKNPIFVEHIHYDSEGNEINVEVHAHPILDDDGNVENIIEYAIDITARKKAEQELLKAYDELEDKVDLRTKELRETLAEKEKIEIELKRSELYFRQLIQNISDIIAISDTNGILSYVSPSIKQVLGYDVDELINESFNKVIHPDDLQRTYKAIKKSMNSLSSGFILNNRCIHKNGNIVFMESHVKALYYDDELKGIIFTARDITKRKKDEDSLRKLISAIEQTPTCIVITDTDGRIEYVNPYFENLTGYSLEEVIGKNPRVLNAGITPKETFKDLWETITKGEIWRGEFINKKKNGNLYEESVIIAPITDNEGTITNYVAVKENITELKKAREAAIIANQAKSKFLANMSHEIRTPLNGIIGFLQLLSDTNLNEKQKQYVETIKLSSDALLRILNDILDFSKLESNMMSLDITEFNISDLAASVVNMFSAKAAEKNIELLSLIDPSIKNQVFGDSLKLTQILSNLLGNAIKFTPENGNISVVLNLVSETDNKIKIYFAVYDNGMGIEPEKIEKIFDSFSQADSSITRKFGGTGLGLAISKRIVDLMGGDLKVESKPGAGSKFYFELEFDKGKFVDNNLLNLFKNKKICCINYDITRDIGQIFILGKYFDAMGLNWEISDNINVININKFDLIFINYDDFKENEIIELLNKYRNIYFCMFMGLNDSKKINLNFENFRTLVKPIDISKLCNLFSDLFLGKTVKTSDSDMKKYTDYNAKVLVAEDNEVNQILIKEYLDKFRIESVIANNGIEAIEYLKTNNFDLILMDINMPKMDGIQAVRIIKHEMSYNKPVIALTAHALIDDKRKFFEEGFDDYLPKPLNINKLVEILNKYLGNNKINNMFLDNLNKYTVKSISDKLGISEEIFSKLLEKFFIRTEELINDLKNGIEERNSNKICSIAHNLKGMTGNLHFDKLQEISKNIELEAKNKNFEVLADMLSEFKKELQIIKTDLT